MRSSRPWQTAGALALWLSSACAHEVQELDLSRRTEQEGDDPPGSDDSTTSGTGGGGGSVRGGSGGSGAGPGKPSGGTSSTSGSSGKGNGGQPSGGKASADAGTSGKGGSSAGAGGSGKAGSSGASGASGSGGGAATHQACKSTKLAIDDGESSSVEDPSLGPELAFDGVATTRWSSGHSEPQWLSLDLGEVVRVDRVLIRWENAYAADYQVALANDEDGPWTPLFRDREGDGATDDVDDFDPDTGRFLRFSGTRRATVFGFSIFELEVYGDTDEACIAQ